MPTSVSVGECLPHRLHAQPTCVRRLSSSFIGLPLACPHARMPIIIHVIVQHRRGAPQRNHKFPSVSNRDATVMPLDCKPLCAAFSDTTTP